MRIGIVILILSSLLSAADDLYLNAKGKKIPLKVSQDYVAITSANAEALPTFTDLSKNPDVVEVVQDVPLLQKKQLKLVRVTPGKAQANQIGPAFSGATSRVEQLPVYALGSAEVVAQPEIVVELPVPLGSSPSRDAIDKIGKATEMPRGGKGYRYLLTVQNAAAVVTLANSLDERNDVNFAEPNFVVIMPFRPKVRTASRIVVSAGPRASSTGPSTVNAAVAPNAIGPSDPFFPKQWALENNGTSGKKGADVGALKVFSIKGTDKVVIAILDEGVDTQHKDLSSKIVKPFDAVSGGDDQTPNSWDGHGTACAGIAAALTNNAEGIAGLGIDARIMPVRIASSQKPKNPEDEHPWVTTYEIIADGIRTAVSRGADVISASWGGGYSQNVNEAISEALTTGRSGKGTVIVFAAGNDSKGVNWPANLSSTLPIIAVAATNEWDELKTKISKDGEDWWGSNHGPEVTVSAPGVHIFTTDISGDGGYAPGDYFDAFNGTSSAAPLVAGEAALLLTQHPDWTARQVRDRIAASADPVMPSGEVGAGRVNVCKALAFTDCAH